jgi:hypothetical protein
MKWTVVYLPAAEQEHADLWLDPGSRAEVTDAANRIDRMLERDPDQVGESRQEDDQRVLFVAPLGVLFRVKPQDCLVEVIHVWKFS